MARRRSRREAVVLTVSRATLWLAAVGACLLVLGFGLGGYSLGRNEAKPAHAEAGGVADVALNTPPPKTEAAPTVAVAKPAAPSLPKTPAPPVAAAVEKTEAKVEPAPPPPVEVRFRKAPRRGYGIQLGAFESKAEAKALAQDHAEVLSAMPVHIVSVSLGRKGTWYRVRVGRFKNKRAADKAKAQLPSTLGKAAISVSYQ